MSLWNTLFGAPTSGSASKLTNPVSLTGLAGGTTTSANVYSTGAIPTLSGQQFRYPKSQAIFTSTGTPWNIMVPRISKISIEGDDVVLWQGDMEWAHISLAVLRDVLGPILEKALLGAFK